MRVISFQWLIPARSLLWAQINFPENDSPEFRETFLRVTFDAINAAEKLDGAHIEIRRTEAKI